MNMKSFLKSVASGVSAILGDDSLTEDSTPEAVLEGLNKAAEKAKSTDTETSNGLAFTQEMQEAMTENFATLSSAIDTINDKLSEITENSVSAEDFESTVTSLKAQINTAKMREAGTIKSEKADVIDEPARTDNEDEEKDAVVNMSDLMAPITGRV